MIFVNGFDAIIGYLDFYHPYHAGQNANFNSYSGKILDMKDYPVRTPRQLKAIEYFYNRIDPMLKKGISLGYVPSSKVEKTTTGVRLLVERLALNGRHDVTNCIRRIKNIDKLAYGGCRDKKVHLDSIVVIESDLVKGKELLILDDVTTSGNSFEACRELFLEKGAKVVQCLALGQTA